MVNPDVRARPSAQESGQILVMTAVTMVVLLGIAALSLDASFMYDKRNRLQAAADAAAKSAAIEVFRNPGVGLDALKAFADQQVAAHGFTPTRLGGTTSVEITRGPMAGGPSGNDVQAVVYEDTSTFFARILGTTTMRPTARAVAGPAASPNCLIALDRSGAGLAASGDAALFATGCNLLIDAALDLVGSGTVLARAIGIVGGYTGSPSPTPTTGMIPATDPLAELPPPPLSPTPCVSTPPVTISSGVSTLSPADIPCGLIVFGGATVHLTAGKVYALDGNTGVRVSGATLDGAEVMIYNHGSGRIDFASDATVRLSAQTSGIYKGILLMQDPGNPEPATFASGIQLSLLSGALYFPKASLRFSNTKDVTSPCLVVVAGSITLTSGHLNLNTTCTDYGGSPLRTVTIIE